jgi:hypothetical protein
VNTSLLQLANIAALVDANSASIDTHPSWSADGLSLLLESDRDGTTSLYRVQSPAVLVLQEGRQPNGIKQIPPTVPGTLTPDQFCVSRPVIGVNIRADHYPIAGIKSFVGSDEDPWRLKLVGYVDVPEIGRYYKVEGAYEHGYLSALNEGPEYKGWLSEQITSGLLCDSNEPPNLTDLNLPVLILFSDPSTTYGTATFTPNPPPTPTSPPDLSSVFPMPIVYGNNIRLTRCGLHIDGDLVLGIDLNPVEGANQSFPLIAPADGTVVTFDTDYTGDNNAGLGNFIAIRISMEALDPVIKARLNGETSDGIDYNQAPFDGRYQNILDVSKGAIYIGYGHLKDNSIPLNLQVGSLVYKGDKLGESGNTGLTDGNGNPITNGQHLHVTAFYHPEIILKPNPEGWYIYQDNYNWYFWAYDLGFRHPTDYGEYTFLVNPLVLWPSAQQDTLCPYWQILQPSN